MGLEQGVAGHAHLDSDGQESLKKRKASVKAINAGECNRFQWQGLAAVQGPASLARFQTPMGRSKR
ncbi:hypothetical protein DU506_16090 [Vreelandella rituensis]|uniref:Uncharacterized protein n=1 Tax=Vreelandella rituensis TaxID=2282306 RepID=A0A368TSW7_9GAMM|nr:hypothetical protein DU506_16090 [Halomonas rituensis]